MKNYFSILVFLILCIQIVGCAHPKMHITYKIDSGGKYLKKDICDKKIGVLTFNDKRNVRDRNMDNFFEETPTKVFKDLLVSKFKAHCGDNAHPIDFDSNKIDKDLIIKINNDNEFDYILVGSLNSFSSNFKDKNSGLRMVGAVVSGLTFPIGLVIFPFILLGDVDQITDIQVDNIALIDVRSERVLWRGRTNKQIIETIPYTNAGMKTNEERYNDFGKEIVDNIFQNISLSYEMKFPNQLSVDNSKVFISHMSDSSSSGIIQY